MLVFCIIPNSRIKITNEFAILANDDDLESSHSNTSIFNLLLRAH
ncbi:hypothetical protein THIOSC15_160002 [uncultured Thiomicrorhabdus sp.]